MSVTTRQAAPSKPWLLILAFAGCSLGLAFGLTLTGQFPLPAPILASPTPVFLESPTPAPDHAAFGVLVALLDRTANPPQFLGAWFVYTLPGPHTMYLQGVPYDLACVSADGAIARLDGAYRTSGADELQGDRALRAMVQRLFDAQTVDYLIVLDAAALDDLAGQLAPVAMGDAAPGTPPSAWWFDPAGSDATLARQEQILNGLLAALHRERVDDLAGTLYAGVTRTGRTDLSPEQFKVFLHYLATYGTDPTRGNFLRLDSTRQYCQP